MQIDKVIDATERAAQHAARLVIRTTRIRKRGGKNVREVREFDEWPKPEDPAGEVVATGAFLAWLDGAGRQYVRTITPAQLVSVVRVWRDAYFTTFVKAAPDHAEAPEPLTDAPTPDGGGGRTIKVVQCRDCGNTIPLRWFAGEPTTCLACGSHSSLVLDTDEPEPAVMHNALYSALVKRLQRQPAGPATLASLYDLDTTVVLSALARMEADGLVLLNGGVYCVPQASLNKPA